MEDYTREWDAVERAAMGQKNPTSTDWMIRLSARQGDLVVTHELLEQALEGAAWVGQLEHGSHTGYDHWQLFVQWSSRKRWSTIRRRLEGEYHIHVGYCKPRHGTVDQCVEYCSKSSTRVEGPYSHGEIAMRDSQGKRSDLEALSTMIRSGERTLNDLLLDPTWSHKALRYTSGLEKLQALVEQERARDQWRPVKTLYLWGPAGSGKTRWLFDQFPGAYWPDDYRHPWDNYSGERVLILDEYAPSDRVETRCLPFQELLHVLDCRQIQLNARYRNNWSAWDTVIICSNIPIDEQYPGLKPAQRAALERRLGCVFEKRTWDDVPPLPCVPSAPAAVQGSAGVDDDDVF